MGNTTANPSAPLTQNYHSNSTAQPTESMTPPTTSPQQPEPCPLSTPTVSHAEWDECMRQSVLTIGSATITSIVAALMVPAANTLLLLGTGAGVLWSVKRCRTLMRDGILTQEQAEALEHKKRLEKEGKRLKRKMEKEAKQKATEQQAAEQKSAKIPQNLGKTKDSTECCKKLESILKQKGVGVDDATCEQASPKDEEPQRAKAQPIGSVLVDEHDPNACGTQDDSPTKISGSVRNISHQDDKAGTTKILLEKPVKVEQWKTSEQENLSKTRDIKMHSSVKLFAPYSRYVLEGVVLTCDRRECTCSSNKGDLSCVCNPTQPIFGEPQQYTLATDDENAEDLEKPVIQEINSIAQDIVEIEDNLEYEDSTNNGNPDRGIEVFKQPVRDDISNDSREEEVVKKATSTTSDSKDTVSSADDAPIVEVAIDDNEDLDVKITATEDGFDVEIVNPDIGDEQVEQYNYEDKIGFAETINSDNWPFSLSLPSLDKFSKKKNSSFKWPPLTSSIIAKPRKEPSCKCSGGPGTQVEIGNEHTNCTCSSSTACDCP